MYVGQLMCLCCLLVLLYDTDLRTDLAPNIMFSKCSVRSKHTQLMDLGDSGSGHCQSFLVQGRLNTDFSIPTNFSWIFSEGC